MRHQRHAGRGRRGRAIGVGGGWYPAGTVVEMGSTLLMPLMKIWAMTYRRQVPGVTVSVNGGGSGLGIASAMDGKADIGASDAYLSSGDLVKAPSLLNIPLAVSAQLVIYNLPGLSQGSHVELNGQVLADMYDGTITRWNDPVIAQPQPAPEPAGHHGGAGTPFRQFR